MREENKVPSTRTKSLVIEKTKLNEDDRAALGRLLKPRWEDLHGSTRTSREAAFSYEKACAALCENVETLLREFSIIFDLYRDKSNFDQTLFKQKGSGGHNRIGHVDAFFISEVAELFAAHFGKRPSTTEEGVFFQFLTVITDTAISGDVGFSYSARTIREGIKYFLVAKTIRNS